MASFFDSINDWLVRRTGVRLAEKVFFAENLKVMVHAGLSMSEALATLALQSESGAFRRILRSLKADVEAGKLLSQGLAKFPSVFPEIFVHMIQAGEVSGTLEASLESLKQQMKKDYEMRSRVRSAMAYPIVVLVAMLGITIALIVYVFPKLLAIFKEFGNVKLPLATRILIAVSDFAQAHGLLLLGMFVAVVVLSVAFAKSSFGKSILHAVVLRLPIFGSIVRKVNLARFSRTVSSLLKTDIPVVQSFTIAADVLGNVHYKNAVKRCAEGLKKGLPVSSLLNEHKFLFPPLLVQMVLVGERSGSMDSLLGDVADFYEKQVDDVLANLSSVIEPVLILLLGGMVGGIALAVMLPLYALTQSVAQSN